MNRPVRILALAGSTRRESYNMALLRIAAEGVREAGARVTLVDLRDYPMPLYDQDLEQARGLPEGAQQLRSALLDHDGLLVASPEYNGSLTAVLKNTLDWLSRPQADGRSPFEDRPAAIISASPGGLGGLRGLAHVRSVLNNLGMLVLPRQLALPAAHLAFASDGTLREPARQAEVKALGARLADTAAALVRPEPQLAA